MWFRLALALGGMTVGELKRRMTWAEALQWMEFESLFGFGDHRADLRSAMVAQAVCAAGGKALDLDTFLPALRAEREIDAEERRERVSPEERRAQLKQQFKAWATARKAAKAR